MTQPSDRSDRKPELEREPDAVFVENDALTDDEMTLTPAATDKASAAKTATPSPAADDSEADPTAESALPAATPRKRAPRKVTKRPAAKAADPDAAVETASTSAAPRKTSAKRPAKKATKAVAPDVTAGSSRVSSAAPRQTPAKRPAKSAAAQSVADADATVESTVTRAAPRKRPARKTTQQPVVDADATVESALIASDDAEATQVAKVAPRKRSPRKTTKPTEEVSETDATVESVSSEDAGDATEEAETTAKPEVASSDKAEAEDATEKEPPKHSFGLRKLKPRKPNWGWRKVVFYGLLPLLILLLSGAAAYLIWQVKTLRDSQNSRLESVAVAKDVTVAMLSYQPDTVDKDLGAARDRLTGSLKDSYTRLTHDVVIPGAKQQHISAVATVPAVASVSATPNHAVTLVFVNQTSVIGNDPPSATASTVRVTLDKIGGHWYVSGFDPV